MKKEELLEHIRHKVELATLKGWDEYKAELEAAVRDPGFPDSFVSWPLSPDEKKAHDTKTQRLIQGFGPL